MLKRCEDPHNLEYASYGGRGITVCGEWHDFSAFLRDMGLKPFRGASIDRINNDGPYAPGNCRWASHGEQARNTSRNHWLILFGQRITITDAAGKYGINVTTLRSRLKAGLRPEEAVSRPLVLRFDDRTHCRNGHELSQDNILRYRDGSPCCKRCFYAARVEANRKKRALLGFSPRKRIQDSVREQIRHFIKSGHSLNRTAITFSVAARTVKRIASEQQWTIGGQHGNRPTL